MLHALACKCLSWTSNKADSLFGIPLHFSPTDLWSLSMLWSSIPATGIRVVGVEWSSLSLASLKSSSPSWHDYDQRCSSPSLTNGASQVSVDQVSQSKSHGLRSQTSGYDISLLTNWWFARISWPFQAPFPGPGGMIDWNIILCFSSSRRKTLSVEYVKESSWPLKDLE